jgi:CCR4-NOT complex subunit CAF16
VLQRERKALEKKEKKDFQFNRNNGWAAGRTTSTVTFGPTLDQTKNHTGIAGSSNAVMRN